MRNHSRSDESDDDVIEITATDCKASTTKIHKNKIKRAKLVLNDVIDIDEDEDLVIIEKVKTSNKRNMNLSSSVKANSRTVEVQEEDEVMKKFRLFKRFDTVNDYSDHHFARSKFTQAVRNCWAKKIQQEWKLLEKDLPDTIFVRAYEERMDLLRAVIVGAAGTPYQDGLFFFDLFFPPTYPSVPPKVHYHSGGLRLNPNLYNCGKVCLSLLNTWQGGKDEKWIPKNSTVLQVLLSIQALVLNAKPYFNEPGYANLAGTYSGELQSQKYNESTFILSCKTMLYSLGRPPTNFKDLVVGHFRKRAHNILLACKAYMEGVQVGSLAEGGIQDLEESDKIDKRQSQHFKLQVAEMVESLVRAFTQNGAKDCQQFLPPKNQNIHGGNSTLSANTRFPHGGFSMLPPYNMNGFPTGSYNVNILPPNNMQQFQSYSTINTYPTYF